MISQTSDVPRYRVQRDFDDIDRAEFREAAFNIIKNYFNRAINELNSVEGLRGRFIDRGQAKFSCTVVNKSLQHGTAHITVRSSDGRFVFGDISFSFAENAPDNTSSGGFYVASDEYEQFLTVAMPMHGNEPERLTPEQSAEHLWNQFIEHAGISYA